MTQLGNTLYSVATASSLLLPAAGMVQSALSSATSYTSSALQGAAVSGLYKAALSQLPSSVSLPVAGKIAKFSLENSSALELSPATAFLAGAVATYTVLQTFRSTPPPPVIVTVNVNHKEVETKV